MTPEELIKKYVALRDRKAEVAARHKEELAPFATAMDAIEVKLMTVLQQQSATSLKTAAGTAYKQGWTSARVQDWQAVLDYAVENERFDLFERRVSKAVVEEIGTVPGVDVERGFKVNIRRV